MKINLIAIGDQMPNWVETAFTDYQKRMPRECQLLLHEIPMPKRSKTTSIEKLKSLEAELILKKIPANNYIIALDEYGKSWSTSSLADEMKLWLTSGQNISIIIGGPDGLASSILQTAKEKRSLSKLTLPHPVVRIIVAEQLYRAWSILNNHPYHRD